MNADHRAEEIASARKVLDFLEANPEVPLPFEISRHRDWQIHGASKTDAIALAKASSRIEKTEVDRLGAMKYTATIDGRPLSMFVPREEVCERRVVGEKTIEVPDPDAPLIAKTVPVVEWDCQPLLAGENDE